jgi:hypothetical protein
MDQPIATGRKRHRVQRVGLFNQTDLLVLQYEFAGLVTTLIGGGHVDTEHRTWWVDAKPEWETTIPVLENTA